MSIYHRGTIERDRYGYVEFVEMQSVPVLFNEKPSFSGCKGSGGATSP